MKLLVAGIVAGVLLIVGIGVAVAMTPTIDRGACLASHTEQGAPIYMKMGNMMVPIPQTRSVCDVWEYPNGKPL
jgi:hypothetical protein